MRASFSPPPSPLLLSPLSAKLSPALLLLLVHCRWKTSCIVSQVLVMHTIMPWLVPLRFTFIAAILPELAMA
jgi:hypothetical protein